MPRINRLAAYDQRSVSETSTGSRTDTSDATEASILAYENAQLSSNIYPEVDKLLVATAFPGSLPYKHTLVYALPNVPNILIQLVDKIDEDIPPLRKLSYGMSEASLRECDRLLTTLVNSRKDVDLSNHIISNCTASQRAQLIQLLFLRLEQPPFMATDVFCDAVLQKGYFVHPRMHVRKDVANNSARATKVCLNTLNVYQQATLSFFIERCQRWCQSEVAYMLRMDPTANATTTYNEALRYLSRFFAESVIGLPKAYIASKIMNNCVDSLAEIKRDLFTILMAMVNSNVWHTNSINTLYVPRELVPPITFTSPALTNESNAKPSVQKIRSFNWI